MLLALTLAETNQSESMTELQQGNNILWFTSAMLLFYSPLDTIAYCALNYSQGWKACLYEVLIMAASSASIYAAGCIILP